MYKAEEDTQLPGQYNIFDWMPDCIGTPVYQEDKEDPYDPEYRIRRCGACPVEYASAACFDRECKEPFHPEHLNKAKPIETEKKQRGRKK